MTSPLTPEAYTTARVVDSHGIRMVDAGELIWLGLSDDDGRWVTPEAFREFAAAVAEFAQGVKA